MNARRQHAGLERTRTPSNSPSPKRGRLQKRWRRSGHLRTAVSFPTSSVERVLWRATRLPGNRRAELEKMARPLRTGTFRSLCAWRISAGDSSRIAIRATRPKRPRFHPDGLAGAAKPARLALGVMAQIECSCRARISGSPAHRASRRTVAQVCKRARLNRQLRQVDLAAKRCIRIPEGLLAGIPAAVFFYRKKDGDRLSAPGQLDGGDALDLTQDGCKLVSSFGDRVAF